MVELPFAAHIATLPAASESAALLIVEVGYTALATVMARRDQDIALARRLGQVQDDNANLCIEDASGVFVPTGPGAWLFTSKGKGDVVEALAMRLTGMASVFDQSSGYGILRLSGPFARTLISKGAFIDFDMLAFPIGRAAVTVIEHIDVTLWRTGEDSFEIAVFRSTAASFWHWLIQSCAASGIQPSRAI
jgi:Sarcosine oxidase gamma subunit